VYDEEYVRHYWGSPARLPFIPAPELPSGVMDEYSFYWLVGRYVADGNTVGTNRRGLRTGVCITARQDRIGEVSSIAELAGFSPKVRPHDNAAAIGIYSTELTQWIIANYGEHADQKRIPVWLHGQPRYIREAFLEGYLTGDGHWNESRRRWEIPTASKELAIGLRLMGNSLGYTTSFSWVDPRPNSMCANPLRSYRVQFSSSGNAIIEDDVTWQKIRSIEPADPATVYDLVVAEDYSYVADGLVHKGSKFLSSEDEVW
jgi:intein/homing endonuclease